MSVSFETVSTHIRKMTKLDKNILLQARNLIETNQYLANNLDSNVYIHWKNNQPYVLPGKKPILECKTEGFETMVNTVKLSSILNGTARFGN